jgi:flagellar hook-length control protein FliK
MTMSSSVTGPDRRPGTEAAKRPGGRREEGGQNFGSALSAEVGRPTGEDEQDRRAGDRAAAGNSAVTQSTSRREAASREAASREAASRAAAERATISRAATGREAAQRAAGQRASSERADQRADRAALERRADARRDTKRTVDRQSPDRAAERQDTVRDEPGRQVKRPVTAPVTAKAAGPATQTPVEARAGEDRPAASAETTNGVVTEPADGREKEKAPADTAVMALAGAMTAVPVAPVPAETGASAGTVAITGSAPQAGVDATGTDQPQVQPGTVPAAPADTADAPAAATPTGTASSVTAPQQSATPSAPVSGTGAGATETAGPATAATTAQTQASGQVTTPEQLSGTASAAAPGPAFTAEAAATLRPESLRGTMAAAETATPVTETAAPDGIADAPAADMAPNTGAGTGSEQGTSGQGDQPGQGGPGSGTGQPATAERTAPESATTFSTGLPQAAAGPAEAGIPAAPGTAGIAGVAAPQAAAPAAPVAEPQAAPPPAPATPTPAAAQLATRIVPLRLDADGVHRLTVNLHPADLGPVQVVAEIRNGDISVQLTGGTDAGTEALRQGLDDLRRELENSGFGNCSLDLRQGNAQQQGRQQFAEALGRRTGDGNRGGPDVGAEPAPAATRRVDPGAGRLDIHA